MSGNLVRDRETLTLEEVCERCGVSVTTVTAYVEEGLVDVGGGDAERWRFSEVSLVHIQKAYRIECDLQLNPPGAVLALELMAQIEELKRRIRRLES